MSQPRIEIRPFVLDQMQVMFYGRRVAYCGAKPNMPINFLTDTPNPHGPQCRLTDEERTEVIQAVINHHGSARKTGQTAAYWPAEVNDGDMEADSGDSGD